MDDTHASRLFQDKTAVGSISRVSEKHRRRKSGQKRLKLDRHGPVARRKYDGHRSGERRKSLCRRLPKVSRCARLALRVGCRLNRYDGSSPACRHETNQASGYWIAAAIAKGDFEGLAEGLSAIAGLSIARRLCQRQSRRRTARHSKSRRECGIGCLIRNRLPKSQNTRWG